jgi:hypothetical protein
MIGDDQTYQEARAAADAYARLDAEEKARRFVDQNLPVAPELVAELLARIARRDGCHGRETAIRAAALQLVLDVELSTLARVVEQAAATRAVLQANAHPRNPITVRDVP